MANFTPFDLRRQAARHRAIANALDEAAEAIEQFDKDEPPSREPQRGVKITARDRTRHQGLVVTEGIKKTQDQCFEILKAAGKKMSADELVTALKDVGSSVKKATTVTYYLRHDSRFFRPENGIWAIAPKSTGEMF